MRSAALAEQEAAQRAKAEAERARADAESARAQADAARHDAEAQAEQARQRAARSEQEKAQLREQLRRAAERDPGDARNGARTDRQPVRVLFDTGRPDLKPGAREKLARVSGILASHPGLRIEIEGHTDSVGATTTTSAVRASRRVGADYLVSQSIPPATVAAAGFGETQPVATNDTASGRQQNRRVELVVSGEAIGRARD